MDGSEDSDGVEAVAGRKFTGMIELSTGKCLAMPVKLRLAIGIYIYRYSGIFDIQKGAAQLTTTGTPVPT